MTDQTPSDDRPAGPVYRADMVSPAEEQAVAELLSRSRPTPPARFRGALGRRLAADDPGWGPRPQHLWGPALALIASGAVLLVIGALLAVGGL